MWLILPECCQYRNGIAEGDGGCRNGRFLEGAAGGASDTDCHLDRAWGGRPTGNRVFR